MIDKYSFLAHSIVKGGDKKLFHVNSGADKNMFKCVS